jgi:hypothetical protein
LPVILGQRSAIRTAPWLGAFLEEILAFPNSKHDDIADSLGLIGQLLDKMMVGKRPVNRARKFDPDKDAYRPFRNDRQLQNFFANADDIEGGALESWKRL